MPRVTVSDSATVVAEGLGPGRNVTVRVPAGGSTVDFAIDDDPTSGSDFAIDGGESLSVQLAGEQVLKGIVSSGTQAVHVLTG